MANAWLEPSSSAGTNETAAGAPSDSATHPRDAFTGPEISYSIDHLRASAAAAKVDLEALLAATTVAAFELTEASGAALALRTRGAVVCRARAGETAPPLGTRLEEDSGISGECLRTGLAQNCPDTLMDARVDGEAALRMNIRSVAVAPLRDSGGVIGILEVFSNRPNAFTEAHADLLHQLADVGVMCREQALRSEVLADPVEALQPASLTAVEVTAVDGPKARRRWRSLLLAASAIAAMALIALLGWMRWKELRGNGATAQARPEIVPAQSVSITASRLQNNSAAALESQVGTVNTGTQAGAPDVFASDLVKKASNTTSLQPDSAPHVVPLERPSSARGRAASSSGDELNAPEVSGLSGAGEPSPPAFVTEPDQPAQPTLAVSQMSGGTLLRGAPPDYPVSAKKQRIEGSVVLAATVAEDGTVHDLEVVSGNSLLAKAAKQAVARWQYAPFLLNGHPVSKRTEITVKFKLP